MQTAEHYESEKELLALLKTFDEHELKMYRMSISHDGKAFVDMALWHVIELQENYKENIEHFGHTDKDTFDSFRLLNNFEEFLLNLGN
jgi:hypothetical protein